MVRCDEDWLRLADAFNAAALGAGDWLEALAGLARATGSRAGELIGLGSANTVPFNWVSDLGPDWAQEFIAVGGGDPAVNPIVRAGAALPELAVRASHEFITREERRTNPFLHGHVRHYDIPYVCLTPLLKEQGALVGLAVMRSQSQGEIDARQRHVFESMAPLIRSAVRTQMTLEHQGAKLMVGALEALSMAVFVCDRDGAVKALTPAAEALVSGPALHLKGGMLSAPAASDTRALSNALRAATGGLQRPGAPLASTLVIRGDDQSLVLEVLPLPRSEHAFNFEPRALVVVRGAEAHGDRKRAVLAGAYRLTASEIDIALRLARGESPQHIAHAREASLGTVRSQLKTIFAKLGVSRQAELVARVTQL